MTPPPTPAPGRVLGRALSTLLTVLLTVILSAPFAVTAPAAAVRSGPDVALRAGVDIGPAGGSGSGVGAGSTGYVPPVAGVVPPSGVERRFDPPAEDWGAGHRGVDLTAPHGSPVLSPGPGVVTFAGQVARRGVMVVTHPDGLRTSLEPVAASVPVGTAVAAGTTIAVVEGGAAKGGRPGEDGHAEGEHPSGGTTPSHCAPRSCLHWGVRRGERYIDPLSLLYRPPIVLLPDR
ncbi:M23 family metallopeptidase [Promicromonospora vindobonensis]|uniref:M23 family metallopeptidase n=1 Tax=Promicromonospora vindobonensis TaxID=195748 RepID=A0ABW5VX38_9MICO